MLMASSVPATQRSISDLALCSTVGLITNLPSTLPTYTPAIGPLNGTSEIHTQSELANIAVISGELS